jgi:hypothetical protein
MMARQSAPGKLTSAHAEKADDGMYEAHSFRCASAWNT